MCVVVLAAFAASAIGEEKAAPADAPEKEAADSPYVEVKEASIEYCGS